ncbi:MAG: hypothetical protein GY788_19300 [bacterium]|nr:hypothetical protein [bacterium]
MERFTNRAGRVAGLLFSGFLVLLGLAPLVSEGYDAADGIPGLLIGGVCGVLFYRSATVIVSSDRISLRGHLFTRSFNVEQVADAEVRRGRVGLGSGDRQFLRLVLSDGGTEDFQQFNSDPTADEPTPVELAVSAIQREIEGAGHT